MSMTQKQIKEEIQLSEERLKELQDGYREIPEYEELQKELDELNKRRAEIEYRQFEIKREYREEYDEDIKSANEDVRYHNDLLRKVQEGLDPSLEGEVIENMFKAFFAGTSWDNHKKLQWVDEDGKYCLMKVNSHSEYTTRMTGVVYGGAEWYLFKVPDEFKPYNGSSTTSLDGYSELCIWKKEGGRWGDKRDMKLVEEAIENYENNDFMAKWMEANGFELGETHSGRPKWVHKSIKVPYVYERMINFGKDRGKVEKEDRESDLELYFRDDYYINTPTNEQELAEKYPKFYKDWQDNK